MGVMVTRLPSFKAAILPTMHHTTPSGPKASTSSSSLLMPLRMEISVVSGPTRWRQVSMAAGSPVYFTAKSSTSTGSLTEAASV